MNIGKSWPRLFMKIKRSRLFKERIDLRSSKGEMSWPSGARCAENCGWGGFLMFPRWRSQDFFNLTSLTPLRFLMHIFWKDLSPSRFHFSVSFISRSCFESDGFIAYSNEWDWRERNDFQ